MKLKQINKENMCPNCGKFVLEPRCYLTISSGRTDDLIGHKKDLGGRDFYRCRNCFAEFEESD